MKARDDHTPDCYVRPGEYLHHMYVDGVKYLVTRALRQCLIEATARQDEEAIQHLQLHKEQLERCTEVHHNVALVDLRYEEQHYAGNRFVIALFPQCNISMHVLWGHQQRSIVFAVGKSIFNRTSRTNVGELMLKYGGGGTPRSAPAGPASRRPLESSGS